MEKKEIYSINPKLGKKIERKKYVLVYGASESEFNAICEEVPYKYIQVLDCSDCFTDIIALSYIAVVINPDHLEECHIAYFNEMAEALLYFSEKIIFTKWHPILACLNKNVKYSVLNGVVEIKTKIKYLLLDSIRASKRSATYSDTIAHTIRVLSEIRKNPGITTAELAEIIERNVKTVQRYIATLNCAGEFIEYDKKKKGWFLFENKSELWGDYKQPFNRFINKCVLIDNSALCSNVRNKLNE